MSARSGTWLAAGVAALLLLAQPGRVEAQPADRTGPDPLWTLAADQMTLQAVAAGSAATVNRTEDGIAYRVRSSGLAAGHADTLWVMVFNHPDLCAHPVAATGTRCGVADLAVFGGDPAIGSSVLYGGGHVIGGAGDATFAGSLRVGDASTALFGPGVTNPRGAEIHFRIRDHGPVIPRLVSEQIHTFNGGCEPGQPHEGQCVDVQTSGA